MFQSNRIFLILLQILLGISYLTSIAVYETCWDCNSSTCEQPVNCSYIEEILCSPFSIICNGLPPYYVIYTSNGTHGANIAVYVDPECKVYITSAYVTCKQMNQCLDYTHRPPEFTSTSYIGYCKFIPSLDDFEDYDYD